MKRSQRELQATDGTRWPVFRGEVAHAGRCAICQRSIAGGAVSWLAHAVHFCTHCVEGRSREVADRIQWARAQRSKNA